MEDYFAFWKTVYEAFWGHSVYHGWFYLALVLILVLEKNRMVRRVYGVFPLCVLVGLFNPLTYELMQVFAGSWQYYARLYSLLPIPCILAMSTVLLMEWAEERIRTPETGVVERRIPERGRKPLFRLVFVGLVCLQMVLGGRSVYQEDWMKPARNFKKIPDEVIGITEALHRDEGVTLAVPEELSSYIRQADASFYMPYGRYVNDLGRELSGPHPDPDTVLQEAGRAGCDYIVIRDSSENRERFAEQGRNPCLQAGRYLVYPVKDVERVRNTYNSLRQLIRTTLLDRDGNVRTGTQGYASVLYEYDAQGRPVRETFLDGAGKKTVLTYGYASILRTYTTFSHQVRTQVYLDGSDRPVDALGYAEIRFDYDAQKRVSGETYLDARGNPAGTYARCEITYDTEGNIAGKTFRDGEGNLTMTSMGYAAFVRQTDDEGRMISETYLDENGLFAGEVGRTGQEHEEVFRFLHPTGGVQMLPEGGSLIMRTSLPDSRFSAVHFQIYDALTGEHLLNFGEGYGEGEVSGEYVHSLPGGLYDLRFKGNTSRSDEWIQSYAYLEEGVTLRYHYRVEEMRDDLIRACEICLRSGD